VRSLETQTSPYIASIIVVHYTQLHNQDQQHEVIHQPVEQVAHQTLQDVRQDHDLGFPRLFNLTQTPYKVEISLPAQDSSNVDTSNM